MSAFTDQELERYARHIVLREIGGPGQQKLRAARVLVIGAGGLGAPALLYLAAAGVGAIRLVDDDTVALSNLQRQIIHRTEDVDQPKVASAERAMAALNPGVLVEPIAARLDPESAAALAHGCDLILDGSDNFATRRLVNRTAAAAGIPWVFGAIGPWEGQVALFDPSADGPCYNCVFPEDPDPSLAPSCAEGGVVGALAGVIGAMMALEVIKRLTGAGDGLSGRLLLYDGLYAETRVIETSRDPDCPVCGPHQQPPPKQPPSAS